jgi:hypothetical protein
VVVEGIQRLQQGTAVKAVPWSPQAAAAAPPQAPAASAAASR